MFSNRCVCIGIELAIGFKIWIKWKFKGSGIFPFFNSTAKFGKKMGFCIVTCSNCSFGIKKNEPFFIRHSGPDCIRPHLYHVAFWNGNAQNDVSLREKWCKW
jgi:hypothetical protein